MYKLLVVLMLVAALKMLGLSVSDFQNCHSRECLVMFEKKARDVLKVDWKPISLVKF